MNPFQSLCLFLILGIGFAQFEQAELAPLTIDELYIPDPDVYYCNQDTIDYSSSSSVSISKPAKLCPDIYQPVCAKYQVNCIQAPCPPIDQEFPNACTACKDPNVISYTLGKCKKNPYPKEKSCKDDYPNPPYPCPKNYDPVCVYWHVDCIKAPCPPIQQEYANACMACNDESVTHYTLGPCEGNINEAEYENEGECEGECEYENEWGEIYEEEIEEEEEVVEDGENEEASLKKCNVIPGIQVLCIYDYIPVCGYYNDCAAHSPCYQTFKNACVACYYAGADYYYDGECPDSS